MVPVPQMECHVMTVKKYELTDDTMELIDGGVAYRIRALMDIPAIGVSVGDLGGYVESEDNLSHEGDCWVGMGAIVKDRAVVKGNARVEGLTIVEGNASVSGDAFVHGHATVQGNATVESNAVVGGHATVSEKACVKGHARVIDHAVVSGNVVVSGCAVKFI